MLPSLQSHHEHQLQLQVKFQKYGRVCSFKYNHTRIVKHIADRTAAPILPPFLLKIVRTLAIVR